MNLKNEQQVDFLDVRLASNLASGGLVRSEKKKSTFILVVDVVATTEDLEQIL